jgi:hypothetical protein
MIPQVLEELSVLLETLFEPGEFGSGETRISCCVSGFRHGVEVIGR